jgi:general secretion pathway protein K
VQALFRNADPNTDPWQDPEELVETEMEFGDARFTLSIRDAGAAFNINSATPEMLQGFFALGLSLDAAQADRIAQAVLDWRDEDDIPSVGGAEREEYIRAGMSVLPSNHAFSEVEELRYVMGVTPEIFAAALPFVTVLSSGTNVNVAPKEVLLSLPGMTEAAADEILRLRTTGNLPTDTESLIRSLPAGARRSLEIAERRFNSRVIYRTNQVQITSNGRVNGSSVESRVRLLVMRSDAGAVVLSREFD